MQIMCPHPSKSEARTLGFGRQKLPTFLEERYIFVFKPVVEAHCSLSPAERMTVLKV
jgi:hypothetical protein